MPIPITKEQTIHHAVRAKLPHSHGHLSSWSRCLIEHNGHMETQDFADKLLPELSLDEIEFACDLERVLAEQVKYLRAALASANNRHLLERDSLILDLRARLADKDREISRLQEQNNSLQKRLLETLA